MFYPIFATKNLTILTIKSMGGLIKMPNIVYSILRRITYFLKSVAVGKIH